MTGDGMSADIPNPGSPAARALGCCCPVLDNCRGKWPPYPPDGWWIDQECPVHGPKMGDPDD